MEKIEFNPPSILTAAHDIDTFHCGVPSMDEWLRRRALANQISGASRTYVVTAGIRVVGYYCLSSGGLAVNDAPGSVRRNMPDPIPIAILGRLAVDEKLHGYGLGSAMLQDAVLRAKQACEILGIRGLLVHAISEEAKTFYEHFGFISSPTQPMTLIFTLK